MECNASISTGGAFGRFTVLFQVFRYDPVSAYTIAADRPLQYFIWNRRKPLSGKGRRAEISCHKKSPSLVHSIAQKCEQIKYEYYPYTYSVEVVIFYGKDGDEMLKLTRKQSAKVRNS